MGVMKRDLEGQITADASAAVKSTDVNCDPWSVLKISGLPLAGKRFLDRPNAEGRFHGDR